MVYGDIGTSPLYAIRECLASEHGMRPEPYNVFGVLSLVFWALTLVIVVKYLTFIMRADNKGEGGILALAALVDQSEGPSRSFKLAIPVMLALFGAGLLYGDGIITPAISVLGAVEGLGEQSPALGELIVPITIGILVGLFLVQRHGTGRIGGVFGWVMLLWFASIAAAGLPLHHPRSPRSSRASTRTTRSSSSSTTAATASSCSARSSWSSPAARRSTPTWATSARSRSGGPGTASCSRASCSTTSARAACSCRSRSGR